MNSPLWDLIHRIIQYCIKIWNSLFQNMKQKDQNPISSSSQTVEMTELDLAAQQFAELQTTDNTACNIEDSESHALIPNIPSLSSKNNSPSSPQISMSPTLNTSDLFTFRGKSKWEAMRLNKHFTIQTTLLLKPNTPTYVGAFSVAQELRTTKRSPFSFVPFAKELFSRTEFMLVKSAILVFITARFESSKKAPLQVASGNSLPSLTNNVNVQNISNMLR